MVSESSHLFSSSGSPRSFLGYLLGGSIKHAFSKELLIPLMTSGVRELRRNGALGGLFIPVKTSQLIEPSFVDAVLDQLLKLKFSWRDLTLLLVDMPSLSDVHRCNHSAYRLNQCGIQLWLAHDVALHYSSFKEELLFDALQICHSQIMSDMTYPHDLEATGLKVVVTEAISRLKLLEDGELVGLGIYSGLES
jgi:EAL domain-containing protein (putative c-di-GMP-specific phosphodiesterase class I)